jgi:hypothetical protein
MRIDRLLTAGFVVLVSTARVGISSGTTGASFTGSSTNPAQILNTQSVTPPASFTSATSAIAGRIDLVWTATTAVAGSHTLTYLVLRGPVGGPYAQIGTTAGLTYTDTPGADGTYEYVVQTKIAQGSGFFTSGNSATKNTKSDRTAPTMSATCNGGSCAGWFNRSVTFVVSGADGAGVGMGTATTNVDSAGATTSAAPHTVTVSGESATHSVVYSGADAAGNASGNTSQTVKIDLTAPAAPTGLTSVQGGTGAPITVDLSWTAATDALSGVAGYTVYWVAANPCPVVSPANYPNSAQIGAVTSYSMTGLTATTLYCAYLTATDNAGNVSAPTAFTGPTIAR